MSKNSSEYDLGEEKDSPSNLKMKYLTGKLSYFHLNVENETQARSDNFINRIRLIEEKVNKLQISEEAKLTVFIK